MNYMIVTNTVGAIIEILEAVILYSTFLKRKEKIKLMFFSFVALIMIVVISLSTNIISFLQTLIYIIIFVTLAIPYDGSIIVKMIMSFIMVSINSLAEFLISYLIMTMSLADNEILFYNQTILISRFVSLLIISLFAHYKKNVNFDVINVKYLLILIIPIMSIIVMFQLYYGNLLLWRNGYHIDQYSIGVILLIISNVIILYLFISQLEMKALKERVQFYNKQIEIQKKFNQELTEKNKQIQRTAHDTKNFLIYLYDLISDQPDKAQNFIKEKLALLSNEQIAFTGIAALDAMLGSKNGIAISKNINFVYQIDIQSEINISLADIIVALANGLDNAIEATIQCKKQNKQINMKLIISNDFIFCYIINPVIKKVEIINNRINTTKSDKGFHGIGLESIGIIVNQYKGELDLSSTNETFTLTLMLPNNKLGTI